MTAFPSVTFASELDSVTRKELEQFAAQIEGFLRAAGFNADGSFDVLNVTTINISETINLNSTGGSLLLLARRTLTHAQIKALPTTPLELRKVDGTTSRPGLGYACNLVRCAVFLTNAAGAYTGLDTCALRIYVGDQEVSNTGTLASEFGREGTWAGFYEPHASGNAFAAAAQFENLPLFVDLDNAADLTGGHAANTLFVIAYYLLTPVRSMPASTLVYTTSAHKDEPAAAAGVTVTPSGTAWNNSSWVELNAAVSTARLLTGVTPNGSGLGAVAEVEYEIDVGTGGAGSETVIGTLCSVWAGSQSGPIDVWLKYPCFLDAIATGARVAIRMRKAGTSTATWELAITYYELPVTGAIIGTTVPSKVLPSAAAGLNVVSGASWASGSWTELIAATSAAWTLGAVYSYRVSFDSDWEIDLGTGGAGAEAVITTIRSRNAQNGPHYSVPLWPLLANIASGARVAIRARSGGGVVTQITKVTYYETTTIDARILTTAAQAIYPPAATLLDCTSGSGGSGWTNGAWTEFKATTAADQAITGLVVEGNSSSGTEREWDLGIGAAGVEVVAATFREYTYGSGQVAPNLVLPIGRAVASGSRVAMRMRNGSASALTQGAALSYLPSTDVQQLTALVQAVYPPAAIGTSIAGAATGYTNSAWGQLVASTATSVLITGIAMSKVVLDVDLEIDLGTGGAGSETVLTTLRAFAINGTVDMGTNYLPFPTPHRIAMGTRIALRFRKTGTSTSAWLWAATYLPQ